VRERESERERVRELRRAQGRAPGQEREGMAMVLVDHEYLAGHNLQVGPATCETLLPCSPLLSLSFSLSRARVRLPLSSFRFLLRVTRILFRQFPSVTRAVPPRVPEKRLSFAANGNSRWSRILLPPLPPPSQPPPLLARRNGIHASTLTSRLRRTAFARADSRERP